MNRLRVKLYAPALPASPVPHFASRAARFLIEYCDRTQGVEVTVTGGAADEAGVPLSWPSARCDVIPADQLKSDRSGAKSYADLLTEGSPPFDILFMPHPWKSFPAGRLSPNPASIVAYIDSLAFDDTDQGSVTDARRETARLLTRDCAAIVFASDSLRNQMIADYGIPRERTAVVAPVSSVSDLPDDPRSIVRRLGLPDQFVVCFESADRNAELELAEAARSGALPWPVVVFGAPPIAPLPGSGEESGSNGKHFYRIPSPSPDQYGAVLSLANAVISFTASPTPFYDTPQLDAMRLRKPLLCQASTSRSDWDGGEPGLSVQFHTVDELASRLRSIANGEIDTHQIDAAESHSRRRTQQDQAKEFFEVFWSVHRRPLRNRIRFRTAPAVCREQRIAWLCNHAALHAYEVPLIRSLGFEVYTPKQTPGHAFRSGAVAYADDEYSTLPRWVLERLNQHNFYEQPIPGELAELLNAYFGTVFLSSYGLMVREIVHNFRGRILVRAFGREHPVTYYSYWDNFGGQELWDRITAIGHRFWLAPPYDSIGPYEPEPLRSLSVTLPLGVADRVLRNGDGWTGSSEKILFVCPSINDSPEYYGRIYRDFKYHFGDLPHLIAGSQDKPVDDPLVLGYQPESTYRRLLDELRVMYYHSREPRHLHYHPLEAIVQGMPVVYLKGGLMEEFGGPDQPGACDTEADARRKLRRILGGDRELIQAIRSSQGKLLETFLDQHIIPEWQKKFVNGVMATPLTPGTRPPSAWMKLREPQSSTVQVDTTLRAENLKIGVYLRTVRGGGVFNYVTNLIHRLTSTDGESDHQFEVLLGRRSSESPFPTWPFDQNSRLAVHQLADREYLPGRFFPREQPGQITVPDAPDLESTRLLPERVELKPRTFRQRVKAKLKPMIRRLRDIRAAHPVPAVRTGTSVLLAALCYGRGVVGQRTLFPRGTGARFILQHAVDPDPAPLTYQQVCEIAGRNEVTFFAYPFDQLAADTPLDEVKELPVVVVMYDLAHEYSGTWSSRNLTIHREMHVWAKLARMIVFGSDTIRRDAARRYGIPLEKTSVVTVPPLVARQDPPTVEESLAVRQKYGLPENYILNLGYQGPHKNNVVLLEALTLLKWRSADNAPPLVLAGPDARRFILGDLPDAYAAKVRRLIAESGLVEGRDFFVIDYIAQEDVAGLYGGAAACVSVSQSEAQIHGMILEAMLYKRPLVCSDLPCNVEQLGTEDEYALLVPPDDPATLADALTEILSKPTETQERVERANQWIKGFNWEPVLKEYERIFAVAARRTAESSSMLESDERCEAKELVAA